MASRKKFWLNLISFLILLFLLGSISSGVYAMTVEEEKKLGKQILLELEGQGEMVRDLTLQNFIEKVGYSLGERGDEAAEYCLQGGRSRRHVGRRRGGRFSSGGDHGDGHSRSSCIKIYSR